MNFEWCYFFFVLFWRFGEPEMAGSKQAELECRTAGLGPARDKVVAAAVEGGRPIGLEVR